MLSETAASKQGKDALSDHHSDTSAWHTVDKPRENLRQGPAPQHEGKALFPPTASHKQDATTQA